MDKGQHPLIFDLAGHYFAFLFFHLIFLYIFSCFSFPSFSIVLVSFFSCIHRSINNFFPSLSLPLLLLCVCRRTRSWSMASCAPRTFCWPETAWMSAREDLSSSSVIRAYPSLCSPERVRPTHTSTVSFYWAACLWLRSNASSPCV